MTVSTFLNSCPEQIPITLNQTVIQMDSGSALISRHERYLVGLAAPYNIYDNGTGTFAYFTLQYVPIRSASVTIFKNGVQQRSGIDYFVYGVAVHLTTGATADDEFTAIYMTAGAASVTWEAGIGTIADYEYSADLSDVPEGWLPFEAGTIYDAAAHPEYEVLRAWLADPLALDRLGLVVGGVVGATTFELITLRGTAYRDGVIVTLKKIIKYT